MQPMHKAIMKCAACGSDDVLGPTFLGNGGNPRNQANICLEFTSDDGNQSFGKTQATVCAACGHVAIFLAPKALKRFQGIAASLESVDRE